MKSIREKIFARPWAIAAVLAVVAFAVAAVAGGARVARAAEPTFKDTPIDGVTNQPGFKWVSAKDSADGVAHYLIYNAVGTEWEDSHEACVGWWYFADYSHEHDFDGYLVRLGSDINFENYEFERDGGDPNQLSVGSEDLPFSGTFDGGGFTISNLTNEREGLQIQMDNGFFGWTNKATIKNINFKDCYIGGSYRDGLVAGYAQDTFFLNILCEDCTTSVIPANNVLNLVTNAGISGGTIAGVANGCTLYNCEMRAGRVVTNATAGVAALGGQPLYMGGLVGQANDSTIEYCRVTDKWVDDGQGGKTRDYAEVSGTYETAVSVANYSEVYVGGIVGGMQKEDTGTKVVDCYSTADVYGKAAIYFGVGLGLGVTRAYCGGIAGIVWDNGKGENVIERVHYAGNLHSYQYNQLLLGIPIIQHDAYMGGIVSVGGKNATINQAYFKRSASSTNKEILVYQNWTTDTDGPSNGTAYGPRDDDYTNRDFWESLDYDFAKGTLRNEGYPYTEDVFESEWSENHYNKWAMDYERGIPVHSGSIKATMDFPGSGTVTIGTTTLSDNIPDESYKGWLTTDPYDFAVQGYTEGAVEEGDEDNTIEVSYEFATDKNDSWKADSQNEGFRFMGWYATRDVKVNNLPHQHSLFTTPNSTLNTEDEDEGLISGEKFLWQKNESDGQPDTLTVTYPKTPDNPGEKEYADNDLYVAYAQAQVLLHDVNGGLVNTSGETDTNTSDDWYDYEATITLPTSVPADVNQPGNFVGWTNKSNMDDVGNDIGYTAIGSTELTALKENGQFWAPGATFTVTEPTNLYPVYSQYNNIDVIYEGHDENTIETRTGYGTAAKATDATTGDLILSVQPFVDSPLLGADPTVRFLGWYEYVGDATTADEADKDTDPTHWLRVSRGVQEGDVEANKDCFTFNVTESGADLTEPHIYKARFEYRVDYMYYEIAQEDGSAGAWDYFAQIWEYYGDAFNPIDGPDYRAFPFAHWAIENSQPTGELILCDESDAVPGDTIITEPLIVDAHNTDDGSNSNIVVTTDFPGGPRVWHEGESSNYYHYAVIDTDEIRPTDPDFWFHGWVYDSQGDAYGDRRGTEATDTRFYFGEVTSYANSHEYWIEAHVTGRIQLHDVKDGDSYSDKEVERRYNEKVFFDEDDPLADEYLKPYHYDSNAGKGQTDGEKVSSTTESFSFGTDMSRQGYIFLGWLDMSDDDVSAVVGQITNGTIEGTDAYLAKSYRSVAAYLMTGEEVCTRPMDLYPVYIEFDVNTTTNIAEAGVDASMYKVPADPSLMNKPIAESKGTVEVTFNDEADATVTSGNTVKVDYNADYEATVKVTVDNDQKVWADASKDDVYTFTSLSVYRDGELAQTVPATEFDADADTGTLTTKDAITIVAGSSYEFVANYSPVPVMVTYHYSYDGVEPTESFSTEVGQVLPTPTGTPSFDGYDDAFVVGWTEGNANGAPADYKDSPTILTPGSDVVTGTMHLWPVYRTGSFEVNSNIDNQTDPDSHRGWRKTADGQSAELWAQPNVTVGTTRYTFQGWTTKWETDGENAEIERASTTWTLYGNDRFPDPKVTYTAIYAEVSEIRYHDTDGDVIYTASVTADDNRTFVNTTTVDIPQYNEDGTPVIDETTGEQVTKPTEIKTPIDSQAFTAIAAAIDNKNAAEDAESYEQFVTWQWVDENGEAHRWGEGENNFVNQPARDNMSSGGYMDLYPVTVKLTATDTTETAYTDLTTQLTLNEKTNELEKAMITLQSSYNQEWLKVHIDEVAYAPNSGTVTTAQTNIPVELYTPGSQIGSPVATDTTRDKSETVSGVNLVEGDALFTFSGRITITKTATDEKAAGQVFSFTISNAGGTETRTVSLQMPEKPTNGVYSNTVTVNVPFGNYTVTEDKGWAWRYGATVQHWELDSDANTDGNQPAWVGGGEVTVEFDSTVSANNPDGVTSAVQITNSLKNGSWFDGSDFEHNVMGTKEGN